MADLTTSYAKRASEVEALTVHRPQALDALGDHWEQVLLREAQNDAAQLEALLGATREQLLRDDVSHLVIRGVTSLTAKMISSIRSSRECKVWLDPLDYPTDAEALWGAEIATTESAPKTNWVELQLAAPTPAHRPVYIEKSPVAVVHPEQSDVAARYEVALVHHRRKLRQLITTWAESSDVVFFVCKKAFYNQLRISLALRDREWKCVALVLDASMADHQSGFFDDVFLTDLVSLVQVVNHHENLLLHTQGWLFRNHIPTLIDAFLPTKNRQIVEMMDMNLLMLPKSVQTGSLADMQHIWGLDVAQNNEMQHRAERYLCDHSDGILFPGSAKYQSMLEIAAPRIPRATRNWCSYPVRKFFQPGSPRTEPPKHAGELKLVFAGGVVPTSRRFLPSFFKDAQLVTTFERMLKLGLRIDVYNNPLHASPDTWRMNYPEQLRLMNEHTGRFRFLLGDMPWNITKVLAQYDYGLILGDFEGLCFGPDHYDLLAPSKLFLYMEAGIPVLVSEKINGAAEFVDRYHFGRILTDEDMRHLDAVLMSLDHLQLKQNVLRAREFIAMDVQVERLISLYHDTSPGAVQSPKQRAAG